MVAPPLRFLSGPTEGLLTEEPGSTPPAQLPVVPAKIRAGHPASKRRAGPRTQFVLNGECLFVLRTKTA